MSFILTKAEDVLSSDSFKSIPAEQNILSELLSVTAMKNKASKFSSNYKSMSVSDLRWELATKKLDVDGSREILIARLGDHSDKDTELNNRKRKST